MALSQFIQLRISQAKRVLNIKNPKINTNPNSKFYSISSKNTQSITENSNPRQVTVQTQSKSFENGLKTDENPTKIRQRFGWNPAIWTKPASKRLIRCKPASFRGETWKPRMIECVMFLCRWRRRSVVSKTIEIVLLSWGRGYK